MPHEISSVHGTALHQADPEPVLRIGNREIFWRPRYLRPSRYLEHLPFLFWLIADLRPHRCVTLGLDTGVAHFALCQATEKLGLEALCHGLDARANGGANGGADKGGIPAPLQRYNAEHYDDFSRLDTGLETGDAPQAVAGTGLDLLVVDRPLDARLLAQLGTEWDHHMARPGVTVIGGLDAAARDPDTMRALAGLQKRYPHVRFDHGGGLLALCHGMDDDSQATARRIRRLAGLAPTSPEHHVVHQVFRRLGQLNASVLAADREGVRARKLEGELQDRASAHATVEAELEQLRSQYGTLSQAYDERHARVAGIDAELFELREALRAQTERGDRLQADLTAAQGTQADLVAQLTARDRRLAELTATQDQQAQAQAGLEQSLAQRQDEVEKLIARLEAREEAYQAEVATCQERSSAAEAAQAETAAQLETAQAKLEEATARRKEFWRQGNELREQRKTLEATLARAEERADTAESQLGARDTALAEMAAQLEAAQQAQEALNADIAARQQEVTILSRRFQEADAARTDLTARLDAAQAELEEANTRRKEFWRQGCELREQTRALQTRADTAEAQLAEARQDIAAQLGARDAALAEMAAQLETAQRSCTALQARADERTAEIARLSDKLEKALVKRDALRKRIDLLVNSTSWRVTAPLRRAKTALSGSAEK